MRCLHPPAGRLNAARRSATRGGLLLLVAVAVLIACSIPADARQDPSCRAGTLAMAGKVCLDLRQTTHTAAQHALVQPEVARAVGYGTTLREAAGTGFYNHSAWFFGGTDSIPRWTGYAVGQELVRRYLGTAPGRTAATLVGEPAATFTAAAR